MELRRLPDSEIHSGLKNKSQAEREILSEVVRYIYEVDRRRLYEKFGYPSLFEYLVKEMKYSNGSAQRRIDAARLLRDVPELIEDIESGAINLSHVSAVAHGIKQQKKEQRLTARAATSTMEVEITPTLEVAQASINKRELLEKVKGHTLAEAQELVAQSLNLEIKTQEKRIIQKDGSVRIELTLTADEARLLQKAKDLLSHSIPGASNAEILMKALSDFVHRKYPATKGSARRAGKIHAKELSERATSSTRMTKLSQTTETAPAKPTSTMEVTTRPRNDANPRTVSAPVRRELFQKQQRCQWADKRTGHICGSTFQLQIDHRKPIWAGGESAMQNLQVLCSAHNKMKYKIESGRL